MTWRPVFLLSIFNGKSSIVCWLLGSFCERKRYNAVLTFIKGGMRKQCHYRNQDPGQPERKEIAGREETDHTAIGEN